MDYLDIHHPPAATEDDWQARCGVGEPAEFGKNRTLTVQASRPRLTVAC